MSTNLTFLDFFNGQRMTRLANSATIKAGIPRVLPVSFYTPGPTKPYNDKAQWMDITFNRGGARVVARNAPPYGINVGASQWKFLTLFNVKEEYELEPDFLNALASDINITRENATNELMSRMEMFNLRTETTRTNMVHSAFSNGKIWIGSDGQTLGSSSGAAITLSFLAADGGPIALGNQITKNGSGSTYNIGDFSSPATDIGTALKKARIYMLQNYGYMATTILYSTNMPTWLRQNTGLAPYFARNPMFNDKLVAQNEIADGVLGWKWVPAELAFNVVLANANDTTGTPTQMFVDNFIGIMPDPSPLWYEFIEGGSQVPKGIMGATTIDTNTDMAGMMNSYFDIRYGKYSYGVVKGYPSISQSMVQGDVFAPGFKSGPYMFGTMA